MKTKNKTTGIASVGHLSTSIAKCISNCRLGKLNRSPRFVIFKNLTAIALLITVAIGFSACGGDDGEEPIVTKNHVTLSGRGFDVASVGLSGGQDTYNSGGKALRYLLQVDVNRAKGYFVQLKFLMDSTTGSEIPDGTYTFEWNQNTASNYKANTIDYYFLVLSDYMVEESNNINGPGIFGMLEMIKKGNEYEFTYEIFTNAAGYLKGYYKGSVYKLVG